MATAPKGIHSEIEAAILQVLDNQQAATLAELIQALEGRGIHAESNVKGSVWRLISEKRIELTDDRRIRIAA